MDTNAAAVIKSNLNSNSVTASSVAQEEISSSVVVRQKKIMSSEQFLETKKLVATDCSAITGQYGLGAGSNTSSIENGGSISQLLADQAADLPSLTNETGFLGDRLAVSMLDDATSNLQQQLAAANVTDMGSQEAKSALSTSAKQDDTEQAVKESSAANEIIEAVNRDETDCAAVIAKAEKVIIEEVVEETCTASDVTVKQSADESEAKDAQASTTVTVIKDTGSVSGDATATAATIIASEKNEAGSTNASAISTTLPTPTVTDDHAQASPVAKALQQAVVADGGDGDGDGDGDEEVEVEVEEESVNSDDEIQEEEEVEIKAEQRPAAEMATETVVETFVTAQKPRESETLQSKNETKKTTENVTYKQAELNNQIKDIISDIDSNIEEQEHIAQLKQQEIELLKKQQALTRQIEQQQILANQLAAQNRQKQLELQQQQQQQKQQQQQQQQQQQHQQLSQQTCFAAQSLQQQQSPFADRSGQAPQSNSSKYETFEEIQHENGFTRKSEIFETAESSTSNVTKTIDLRKIFTPATDAPEILPKNRKLYASSAFYSPTLHPTVEDQVELARRISHSLSDISNHKSKGQSMYDNRKKRSVKWVHEGCAQGIAGDIEEAEAGESKENTQTGRTMLDKLPLKLVMNPRGQMRDYSSVSESLNIETGLLSPDNCAELISALQLQKGRGAELFAKRRRKADNWVVDETNAGTQSPSGIPDYQQYQPPKQSKSPSLLPAYSDAGKHRVQLNMHQEQMIEKYAKPGVKVVKSPWEAALETGSASTAFLDDLKPPAGRSLTPSPGIEQPQGPAPQYCDTNSRSHSQNVYGSAQTFPSVASTPVSYRYGPPSSQQQSAPLHELPQQQYQPSKPSPLNPQRDLAYKPSIPQGWRSPGVELPREKNGHQQLADSAHQLKQSVGGPMAGACVLGSAYPASPENQFAIYSVEQEGDSDGRTVATPLPELARLNMRDMDIVGPSTDRLRSEQPAPAEPPNGVVDADRELTVDASKLIDVQTQLQQLEQLQQYVAHQQERDRLIVERREQERLMRKFRQEKRKQILQPHSPWQGQSQPPQQQQQLRTNVEYEPSKVTTTELPAYVMQAEDNQMDEYVKVDVRDLISSFEQQALKATNGQDQQQPNQQQEQAQSQWQPQSQSQSTELTDKAPLESGEGLYVPKEIPLDSYAPPPVYSPIPSKNQSQGFARSWTPSAPTFVDTQYGQSPSHQQQHQQQQLNWQQASVAPAYGGQQQIWQQTAAAPSSHNYESKPGGFPFTKPSYQSGFSTSAQPRQQLYGSNSYQKAATTTGQAVPQVNFNPSPISYEKLSKFENRDCIRQSANRGNGIYSPERHLNVRGTSLVRNSSPTPFGGGAASTASGSSPVSYGTPTLSQSPYSPRLTSSSLPYDNNARSSSYNKPSPVQQTFNTGNFNQGPTFNKTARGWRSGGMSAQSRRDYVYQPKVPVAVNTGALPYSDF